MNIKQIIDEVHGVVGEFCQQDHAKFGCILGSGLGGIAEILEDARTLSYADIPYLKPSSVEGHAGKLCLGRLNGQHVVFLQGRPHWYEGSTPESFISLIASLTACKVNNVIVTNAVGGINANYKVGDVVMITDQINMQFKNPLIGVSPPAFISMDQVYDENYQKQLLNVAKDNNINLHQGVYCGVLGPVFETPAEILSYKSMGADLVAMSVIPEVIVSRYLNCKVVGLSVVSNSAAGMSDQQLSHDVTLAGVARGKNNLELLLREFLLTCTN